MASKNLLRQIKSTDYSEQTVMEFTISSGACTDIFVQNNTNIPFTVSLNKVDDVFQYSFDVDGYAHGDVPLNISRIQNMTIETELEHDFKVELYVESLQY